jgi:multiple sugar transport system ATP-binding protein
MATITLAHIDKVYPNGYVASRDLNLEIGDGEFLVLVGPSGSGKSTVLRMIAGLERATAGTIRIAERDVTSLPPQERDIAMVFQSYALYPHMTVRDNISFGLRIRRLPPDTIARRVNEVAESLGLAALLDRKPAQLSGGQRQRVALGRAIAREPKAFLFDEPLSNLDAKLRVETRAELSRLHRRLGATMVYVTHDQVEAMTLGDRVAVLKDGVLQQVAPPMELYQKPANQFVAGFIGTPVMNFIEGTVRAGDNGPTFESAALNVQLPRGTLNGTSLGGARVVLGVRPQHVIVGRAGGDNREQTRAEVSVVEPLGDQQIVHLTLATGERLLAAVAPDLSVSADQQVSVGIVPDAVHLFRADDGSRIGS